MKKLLITINLFLFLSIIAFGQTKSKRVDILWGPEQKESKRSTLSDFIGNDANGIYLLSKRGTGLYGLNFVYSIEHFDDKMIKTKSVELELKEQKEREFEFIVYLNNNIYVFSSFINQKIKNNYLFVQSINKETLQPNNDLKMIAEIDYSGHSKYNSGKFNYKVSSDSSKFLIYYELPYDKNENECFGFHVFDVSLNKLWEKQIVLPYKDGLFEVEDFKVDNNGNVHLLGLIFQDKRKEKRNGEPNYKYQILSYYNNGNDLEEYYIQIEDKFLTDMKIAINNDDNTIICAGFYSSKGTYSIEGSYFLKIDSQTKEIISKEFQKFGIDFITQNMTERGEKKTKKKVEKGKNIEMFQYDLDNIILKDDGGAILIGEQYYITSHTHSTSNSSYITYYYHYNDIVLINISPEGKIQWTEKIPKRQVTRDDGGFYSSYAVSVVKDKLYFVFNDNPKNLFYKGKGKLYNFNKSKESLVVLVTVESDGTQIKEALFSAKDTKILTRPAVCEQISDNEMIIFGQKRKKHRFAKITFKD